MRRACFALLLVASCSSSSKRSTCSPAPEPVKTTRCAETALELDQLRAQANQLVGRIVTIAGPLRDAHPWCIDCCPPLGAVLALAQDTPFVRVSLDPWWCPAGAGGAAECPLPRDGRRIIVRGRLDRVQHGQEGDLVLHDTKLCEAP